LSAVGHDWTIAGRRAAGKTIAISGIVENGDATGGIVISGDGRRQVNLASISHFV
jgi:hypothetical protein